MAQTVYLITPPFTQLNTPYPATAYLKGFFNTKNISSFQSDLGIEVLLALFCANGFRALFDSVSPPEESDAWSDNARRIYKLREAYINTIDEIIRFLQGKNPTLAHKICKRNFLPEASRFAQLEDLQWAFGNMGIQDKAKHFATLYMEDMADFISECIDPYFGFSRYAERLGRSANSFDELYQALQQELSLVDKKTVMLLEKHIQEVQPKLAAISVPFPGNLFAAFRCAQWIKQKHPGIKTALGGGFANTELRSLSDVRVMEFFDFICLDDGELPLENIVKLLEGNIGENELKRSFVQKAGTVCYINNSSCQDYRQSEVGTPDYSDLLLDQYISAIEIANPMHSLWSDGRWNKLTMAHGCYWGKCTFCDTTLHYISHYEQQTASSLCDKIETIIAQTGQNGFHFVDEAAPPALMRELALEILRRKLNISWWANIRFEKSFTKDLCLLLQDSGCIAVSGGLEVASDRLLALIDKGITVAQVAKVTQNFTQSGIMVHAYLMYGYPTQTAQETIDSLEMVRQMFEAGVLQSAFWHQFALTVHSPVGQNPEQYNIIINQDVAGSFANNDLQYTDLQGTDHDSFSYGLKKSLFNYMHGACLDYPLHKWFDFKVPPTRIAGDYIAKALEDNNMQSRAPHTKVYYTGMLPDLEIKSKSRKGNTREEAHLSFHTKNSIQTIKVDKEQGKWLYDILAQLQLSNVKTLTLQEIRNNYEQAGLEDFELFWDNKPVNTLNRMGLLQL